MSEIVEYLDTVYSDRLLVLKIDAFQLITFISDPALNDEELTDLGHQLWTLYVGFMNRTVKQVEDFSRDAYDTEDRHVNMMTQDYITDYVGHPVFTEIIVAYEKMHADDRY